MNFLVRSTKLVLTERTARKLQQLGRQEVLVRLHAGGDDAQQVVVGPLIEWHSSTSGRSFDQLVELPHRLRMMVLERHHGVGQDRQPDGGRAAASRSRR